MSIRGMQVLIAIDQVFNTLVGNGFADETLSARAWRNRNKNKKWAFIRVFIDALFFFQTNHCEIAYVREATRAQLPPEYREELEEIFK